MTYSRGNWLPWRGSHGGELEASGWQPHEFRNGTSSPRQALGDCRPDSQTQWLQPHERPDLNHPAEQHQDSWTTETAAIIIFCLKLLSFGYFVMQQKITNTTVLMHFSIPLFSSLLHPHIYLKLPPNWTGLPSPKRTRGLRLICPHLLLKMLFHPNYPFLPSPPHLR